MKLSIKRSIATDIEIRIDQYRKLIEEGFTYIPYRDAINAGHFTAIRAPDPVRSERAGEVVFTKTVYAVVFERGDRALLYLMNQEKEID